MVTAHYGVPVIKISQRGKVPAYVQLADFLRAEIKSGRYARDDAIPSIMSLVGQTGLAIGTVRHAVSVLAEEGLVETVSGRGTFVL
jgi:GntR family transcriptional regulator